MESKDFDSIPEDKLWDEYKKNRDPKLREHFILKYNSMVKFVAGKIAVGMPSSVEFDDLVGYGVFGLLDAIEKYDSSKKVKFSTYAVARIRGAIFDELRSIDWVPRSIRQKAREIEETIASLEGKLGRTPTNEEIAKTMNMSLEDYNQLLIRVSATTLLSLADTRYRSDDSDKLSLGDSIEAPSSMNPDVVVEREAVKKIIIDAICQLPEREKQVLIMYYYESMTLREIGEVLHVTESRVSQIHSSANLKLRSKLSGVIKTSL